MVLISMSLSLRGSRFRSVTVAHYRRADAFIIVYDVTNAKSFKDVLSWVNVVKVRCVMWVLLR